MDVWAGILYYLQTTFLYCILYKRNVVILIPIAGQHDWPGSALFVFLNMKCRSLRQPLVKPNYWNSHNVKSACMLSLSGSSRELSQTRRMRDYVQRPVTWVTRLTSGAILEPFYLCTMSCWGLSDDVLYICMTYLCRACNVTPFHCRHWSTCMSRAALWRHDCAAWRLQWEGYI